MATYPVYMPPSPPPPVNEQPDFEHDAWLTVSPEAIALVGGLLQKDPSLRLTALEVRGALMRRGRGKRVESVVCVCVLPNSVAEETPDRG